MQITADHILMILTVVLALFALFSAISSAYLMGKADESERWRCEVEDLSEEFERSRQLLMDVLTAQVATISKQTLSLADHTRRETALLVDLHRLERRYEKFRRKGLFRAELKRRATCAANYRRQAQWAMRDLCETRESYRDLDRLLSASCRREVVALSRRCGPIPLPEPKQEI